jgi:Xaa-Pro aminopeptidase
MVQELDIRKNKIIAALKNVGADACLLTTSVNIYYATGRIIIGYVYIDIDGNVLSLVRRPNNVVGENVFFIRKVEQLAEILGNQGIAMPKKMVVEGDEISFGEWNRIAACTGAELVNGSNLIRFVRSVKTEWEIAQLTLSAEIQSEVLRKVPSVYVKGMTDHKFSVEVEKLFRLAGCLGLFRIYGGTMEAYMGSILAGENACAPSPYDFALGGAGMHPSLPLGHNGGVLKEGQTVMVDINGNFTGYISDQSRTYSVGKLPQYAYDAHQVSIEIQDAIAEQGKPGVTCEELYQLSLSIAKKHGFEKHYMGMQQQAKFVGHGIGLVINELPVLCDRNKAVLEVGNTIALEPKFVFPEVGAVGTENSFVVTENGMKKLTSAPEEIIDLLG